MRYGELITRSLQIVWRHKYLWLLGALGGGEAVGGGGGGGGNFGNFSGNFPGNGPTRSGDPGELGRQVGQWLGDHAGLLVAVAAILFLLYLGYFLLSCLSRGALIRAAAEHDAERPFRLGLAWRAGRRTFWSILGLRLLVLLYSILVVVVIGVLVLLGVLSGLAHNGGGLAAVVALGIIVVLSLIPVSIGVGLVTILAARAIVLEERGTIAAVGRAWALLRGRLGRVLLVWLIQIGISIVLGIALAIAFVILLLPAAGIVYAAYSSGGVESALGAGLAALVVFILIAVPLGGALGSAVSTYWTVAFRRLDLDPVLQPAIA